MIARARRAHIGCANMYKRSRVYVYPASLRNDVFVGRDHTQSAAALSQQLNKYPQRCCLESKMLLLSNILRPKYIRRQGQLFFCPCESRSPNVREPQTPTARHEIEGYWLRRSHHREMPRAFHRSGSNEGAVSLRRCSTCTRQHSGELRRRRSWMVKLIGRMKSAWRTWLRSAAGHWRQCRSENSNLGVKPPQ